ncbi:hypothetical protein quinque_007210 [Culex quinquefasciatus]
MEKSRLVFKENTSLIPVKMGWTDAHWNAVQVVKDNGKAFLIFTGPNGIAAYAVSENCASEEPFESSIPLDMKHGAVLGATLKRDQLTLLVNNGTVIDSVVVAIEKVPARVVPKQQEIKPPNYASMVTLDRSIQQRVLQQPITKRSLWLGETLDTSSIATGVDRTTGRLNFQLPIIDLRAKFGVPIRHSFYYDQPDVDPEAVGVLGVGHWTRSVDFIYVDRKDGVFEEDFEYFLVSDKTKVRLEWVRSGDRREHFAFNGTEVVYHKDRGDAGQWEIKLRDVTCTYGEDERAVRWTLGWPNWNGKGSDRDSVVRRPLEWYLSKTSMNKGGSEVRYSYESDMVVVTGLVSYTKAIVLKQIEDTSEDVKVEFKFRKVSGSLVTSSASEYQQYPFTTTQYLKCPLEIRTKVGFPGKENNINSKRAISYSKSSNSNFLQLLFPPSNGFRYEVKHLPNGAINTIVMDNRDLKVAEYVAVPGYDHILTTYGYDEAGNLEEVLPPNFHQHARTLQATEDLQTFLRKHESTRSKWRVLKKYNADLQITSKETPDAGKYEFLYNERKQLRFLVHYDIKSTVDRVFYYKYTTSGEVFEFGILDTYKPTQELRQNSNKDDYPITSQNYIQFDYGETEPRSYLRGRKQTTLKVDPNGKTTETVFYGGEGEVLGRSYLHPTETNQTLDVVFGYERGNVNEVGYPVQYKGTKLVISYTHNLKGQVVAIGTPTDPMHFAKIEHTPREYDHLVDRASRITLKDGTTVQLGYDIRGERNVKKVVTASGKRTETYYIRDDKGRCLVDIKVVHLTRNAKPMFTLTSYVYGPLGLVGFIRNDAYYSVISDHEGSTRLVVKNGEVVAAYDYLPYGQRLRFYNTDPDGHVAYQYTGQEFDEETGLYNYHARLYDPELGRFYQTDPQDQYPSPYKYAGNSPVMMVDPDGEFALMIACIVFAIVGSYLGAASVNQSWNPLAWNWKSGHTYLGMFSGAVAGAVLPIGGVASFGYFSALGGATFASFATASVALAGAYLGMAGAANDWNPAQWDFTSPALYSGMLSGISVAVNIPSGSVGIARTLTSYTGKAQYGYMAFVIGGSIGFGYLAGSFANNMTFNPMKWQWNARTIVALMEGGSTILMGTSATMKHGPRKQFFELAPPTRPQPAFRRMPEIYEHFHKAVLDDKALWVFKQAKQSAKEIMKHREPLGHYVRGPPGVTLVQIAEFVSPARQLAGNVLSISYMVKEYTFTHSGQRQPHSLKTFSFQNCVPTNSDISSYTCYQSTAKVEVFPKEPTGPRAPHSVVPMDGCAPFHWYGRPAIGCEGQDFAFIYTPYETPKWFSFLDGWLLLVRVGVHVVGDLKLRGCDAERKVSCSEFELAEYGKQLSRIDDILKRNGEVEFDWAKKQLDEMREDLKQYLSGEKISAHVKMIFEEKIEALKEDILDQIANGFEFLRKC